MNPVRPSTSCKGTKSKKSAKNKNKGHSSKGNINNNHSEDTESNQNENQTEKVSLEYAGLEPSTIKLYAGQIGCQDISQEACSILTNDLNYKLRYIINESLIKAKLQRQTLITSKDIEETFSDLSIDKVYGASSNPKWEPLTESTLLFLDDQPVNLIEIAEKELNFSQEGDVTFDYEWNSVDVNKDIYVEYFQTMCQALLCGNKQIRKFVLEDISRNPKVGPISGWFYNFSYLLLLKDVSYQHLTTRALNLLETLENSPLASITISATKLKIIIRILLQRLLLLTSNTRIDTVKQMSYLLSIFCFRTSLKKLILTKLENKLSFSHPTLVATFLNIIYYIGVAAIKKLFLPHLNEFFDKLDETDDPDMIEAILAVYGLICKAKLNSQDVYSKFVEYFSPEVLISHYKLERKNLIQEINVAKVKVKLIKTRRKINYESKKIQNPLKLSEVFEIISREPLKKTQDTIIESNKLFDVNDGVKFTIKPGNKIEKNHAKKMLLQHKIINYKPMKNLVIGKFCLSYLSVY